MINNKTKQFDKIYTILQLRSDLVMQYWNLIDMDRGHQCFSGLFFSMEFSPLTILLFVYRKKIRYRFLHS